MFCDASGQGSVWVLNEPGSHIAGQEPAPVIYVVGFNKASVGIWSSMNLCEPLTN